MADVAVRRVSIVFTDVDGTLVDGEHHAIPESAFTIQRVTSAGIPFCMVSARSPEGLYPIQKTLSFTGPLVCFSGAYVLDEDDHELLSETIPLDEAVAIKDYLSHDLPAITVGTYGFHTWLVDDDQDPRIKREEYFVCAKSQTGHDLRSAFDERGIHKFLLMGEPPAIAAAEKTVHERFPHLNVVRSNDTLCEVMNGAASKSRGVRIICEHYGIDRSGAVAFGDGFNDLDMLEAVEESYAMLNGEEDVKRAARHVTTRTNVDNGVAHTLEELLGL